MLSMSEEKRPSARTLLTNQKHVEMAERLTPTP